MKAATPRQMNEIDGITIRQVGIPGIILMENAALGVVNEVNELLNGVKGRNIIVFSGKGNNGGDAFAAARHLHNKGARIFHYVLCKKSEITGDAAINLNILENMGLEITELLDGSQLEPVRMQLAVSDAVIDGIFGTGFKGNVSGMAKDTIDIINKANKYVVSIDIPSGVTGETGKVPGICIRATSTVTFALPKVGLLVHPGCEYVGRLVVSDIGIPSTVIDAMDIKTNCPTAREISRLIPSRHADSNKGNYGRIFIISGSVGMTGAGCLSARAALRSGAGLVYLGVPSALTHIYDASLTESITIPLDDGGGGYLSKNCIQSILDKMNRMDAAAIGPGLSTNEDISEVVASVVENACIPLILDADALNCISGDVSVLSRKKAQVVVTPHPGEMARLTGMSIEQVQNDRLKAAVEFSGRWGVITVLKGARTVIASPDGTAYINPTGNSGMATGGTGDVLTGVIAGLAGQGLNLFEAAAAGAYIHGLCGDRAAAGKGEHGLIAGDLAEELPFVIKELVTGNI